MGDRGCMRYRMLWELRGFSLPPAKIRDLWTYDLWNTWIYSFNSIDALTYTTELLASMKLLLVYASEYNKSPGPLRQGLCVAPSQLIGCQSPIVTNMQ